MNLNESHRSLLSCLVIESDESCRWMLSFLLQNSGIVQIVAECESLESGLVRLDALRGTDRPVQAILLGSSVGSLDALAPIVAAIAGFAPDVPIVLLSQQPASEAIALELGVSGYWWKLDRPEALLEILSRLQPAPRAAKPSRVRVSPAIAALGRLSRQGINGVGVIDGRFAVFDRHLAQLDFQLRSGRLNRPSRWFLQGQIREILAARWIARQIMPKQVPSRQPKLRSDQPQKMGAQTFRTRSTGAAHQFDPMASQPPSRTKTTRLLGSGRSSSFLVPDSRRLSMLFDQFIVKLDAAHNSPLGALENLGTLPLEMDLLTPELKVALLNLTTQVLQSEVEALRLEALGLSEWADRVPALLDQVWSVTIQQFFRAETEVVVLGQAMTLLEHLLRSRVEVDAILQQIPLVIDWIAYGILEIPLSVENQPHRPGSPQADARALLLLENTIFRLANAVLQPLLNQFSEVEEIKARYFQVKYTSSREIARFRNDLSWRYRRDRWFDNPMDVFESQYRILHLSPKGILETKLYAPRQLELQTLAGLPLVVTLALETRDAIVPRLRSVAAFLGSGVVYLLTEVVGRGIGLVGQGIVKGIGNAWQERR